MKNDPAHDRFHELLWKRSRTDSDDAELRSWLSSHPESQQEADAEEHLNALLDRLPDAPVSSNFTARVLDAVERDGRAPASARPVAWSVDWLWRSLLPRVAVVAVLAAAGFLAWHRHETEQRAELAKSLVTVSEVESLPAAAFLEDFETIRRLGHAPVVDEELLALLQ